MGTANSPNKRQRLTPPSEQAQVPSQMPNQSQQPNGIPLVQQPNFSSAAAAVNFLKQSGITVPANIQPQDIINYARHIASQAPQPNKQLQTYKQNLVEQQSQQGLAARQSIGAGGALPAGQPATIPFMNPGIGSGMNYAGNRDANNIRPPTQQEMMELSNAAKSYGGDRKSVV